ncbi:FtsW/RodA/SpoVE family cell cycle protein, partial [candidate division KSB1 bacterium]
MNISAENRHFFDMPRDIPAGNRHGILPLLPLLLLSSLGFMLLAAGLDFYDNSLPLKAMLPVVLFFLLFACVLLFLRRAQYKGTYIPIAAMVLLMLIGLLIHIRMHNAGPAVQGAMSADMITMNNAAQAQAGFFQIIQSYLFYDSAVRSYTYCIALVFCAITVFLITDKRIDWISGKSFFLLTLTVFLLFLMVMFTQILNDGKFLFSRIPWEPAKIVIPVALAGFLAYSGRFFRFYSNGSMHISLIAWGPFLLLCASLFLLLIILGDLGQVLIYGCTLLVMVFIASESFFFPLTGIVVIVLMTTLLPYVSVLLPEYAAERIALWIDFWAGFPSTEWWDRSYQTAHALFALKAGGLTGTGFGLGHPELVPLSVSDFVYAEIAEELGFG